MEQQTLSVAKAGLVCKLNTRTTIIAATNPKGGYDPCADLAVNIAVASPLLSRFDMVLVLMDTRNPEWDAIVSRFILNRTRGAESSQQRPQASQSQQEEGGGDAGGAVGGPSAGESDEQWSLERLQAYVCYVKQKFQPRLSLEAEAVLGAYYRLQRRADTRNAARTTLRMLESLVRLAQAHARLMHRGTVMIADATIAVALTEASMQGSALLGVTGNPLHAPFPDNPDEEHRALQENILRRLRLDFPPEEPSDGRDATPPPAHPIVVPPRDTRETAAQCRTVPQHAVATPALIPSPHAPPITPPPRTDPSGGRPRQTVDVPVSRTPLRTLSLSQQSAPPSAVAMKAPVAAVGTVSGVMQTAPMSSRQLPAPTPAIYNTGQAMPLRSAQAAAGAPRTGNAGGLALLGFGSHGDGDDDDGGSVLDDAAMDDECFEWLPTPQLQPSLHSAKRKADDGSGDDTPDGMRRNGRPREAG
eukprot:Opistho-2@48836